MALSEAQHITFFLEIIKTIKEANKQNISSSRHIEDSVKDMNKSISEANNMLREKVDNINKTISTYSANTIQGIGKVADSLKAINTQIAYIVGTFNKKIDSSMTSLSDQMNKDLTNLNNTANKIKVGINTGLIENNTQGTITYQTEVKQKLNKIVELLEIRKEREEEIDREKVRVGSFESQEDSMSQKDKLPGMMGRMQSGAKWGMDVGMSAGRKVTSGIGLDGMLGSAVSGVLGAGLGVATAAVGAGVSALIGLAVAAVPAVSAAIAPYLGALALGAMAILYPYIKDGVKMLYDKLVNETLGGQNLIEKAGQVIKDLTGNPALQSVGENIEDIGIGLRDTDEATKKQKNDLLRSQQQYGPGWQNQLLGTFKYAFTNPIGYGGVLADSTGLNWLAEKAVESYYDQDTADIQRARTLEIAKEDRKRSQMAEEQRTNLGLAPGYKPGALEPTPAREVFDDFNTSSEFYYTDKDGLVTVMKPSVDTRSTPWDQTGIINVVNKLDASERLLSQINEKLENNKPTQVINAPTYIQGNKPTLTEQFRD